MKLVAAFVSLSVPRTYSGRYEILRPLGTGTFSHTFVAWDRVLQRDVALKVLRPEHLTNDEFSARFDREAQAAASVSHPNVVPVFDFGREQQLPFIVMQFINGRTLREFDRDEGPLTTEEVVGIIRQVLDGLAAIHDQGIIHRDVKPQNVLLDDRMVARLSDFGVAFLSSDVTLTDTGATIGTVAYMAPEQATGQVVGPTADLYSTGVMLYELLTRRLPFQGNNPVQILYRHVSDLPTRPRDLNPRVPLELEAVVLRALAKIPAERFPNARAMRDALSGKVPERHSSIAKTLPVLPGHFERPDPVLHSPTATRHAPATTSRRRRQRRRSWVLPTALTILFLAVAGIILALAVFGGAGDEPDRTSNPTTPSTTMADDALSGGSPSPAATESPSSSAAAETPIGAVPASTASTAPTQPANATITPPATATPDGAPDVEFNTPFAAAVIPPAWGEGQNVTFGRDDFVDGGAYRRTDGVLYDRPAAHLYARNTEFSGTTVRFTVAGQPERPDSLLGIVIVGMDDELPAKAPCRLSINGEIVWEGDAPFGNEVWTPIGWRVGNLSWLRAGNNEITFEIVAESGEVGLPPWVLLNSATIYWG